MKKIFLFFFLVLASSLCAQVKIKQGGTEARTQAGALKNLTPDSTGNTAKYLQVLAGGGFGWATAGGLTDVTDSLSVFTPNDTKNVKVIIVTGGTTNADLAIIPKGTGALIANLPDGTASGGNARGIYAIDLSLGGKNDATDVASGAASTIVGGLGNSATSTYATTIGGTANHATATQSFIGGGVNNTAAATNSTVFGSNSSANSGASYSIVSGFRAVAYNYAQRVHASGRIANDGDAQISDYCISTQTTNATPTNLTIGGYSNTSKLVLNNQSAWTFRVMIIGKQSATASTVAYDCIGRVKRGANAAATTVSNVTVTTIGDDITVAGAATITADTTNGALIITVTGKAATTINWVGRVTVVEVAG